MKLITIAESKPIASMGHFTAIGMRAAVSDADALVINTCGRNDTAEMGSNIGWVWSNPTNRAITHEYLDVQAVSVEALWQGTKLMPGQDRPDPEILAGAWRKNKGKRPIGAYAGPGNLPISSPGSARRAIYIPAFKKLVEHWLSHGEVAGWVAAARAWPGPVYLRDFDVGRGLDRNGPMSHAWVMATWLNTGSWPE